jgi:hypothetical protein
MTQQTTTFKEILEKHEELRNQVFDIEKVQKFLNILAEKGADTEDAEQRAKLRDYIYYWSSKTSEETGKFPLVRLQPFDLSQVPRRSNLNFFRKLFRPSFLIILALIIIIPPIVIILIRSSSSILHPSPTPTPRPTQPSAFHCPTSQQVSAWMHVDVSQVTSESCAFTAGKNGKQFSGVVCTSQDGGTTIEFIPVNQRNTEVVRACDGSQLPNIWGLTIRFISGYPSGDASVCAIARNARNNVQAGWKVQADC